eukprot:6957589-Prymnesium_polylepis.1
MFGSRRSRPLDAAPANSVALFANSVMFIAVDRWQDWRKQFFRVASLQQDKNACLLYTSDAADDM